VIKNRGSLTTEIAESLLSIWRVNYSIIAFQTAGAFTLWAVLSNERSFISLLAGAALGSFPGLIVGIVLSGDQQSAWCDLPSKIRIFYVSSAACLTFVAAPILYYFF